jgi:serine/threonine protein kinase
MVPSQLGDFRIVREIGRGGMGVVYEAIQISLQRRVALKVINVQTSDQDKLQIRFRREAEAAAGLHHTNIVQVYGSGVDSGVHYYAMQLIQGAPLNEVIDWLRHESRSKRDDEQSVVSFAGKKLLASAFLASETTGSIRKTSQTKKIDPSNTTCVETTEGSNIGKDLISPTLSTEVVESFPASYYRNVARIIADIANALGYAHRQRILHRDIKPANLILDRGGAIWVTDFGLARRLDSDGATQAGEVLGTIRYMAPEQIAGEGDARMDIYSLGLCLYELTTLNSPFDAPKQRLLDPLRFSVLPAPRKINPKIPADLATIIQKACAVESEARYANAMAFEDDLRRFLEDRPILAKKASSWEHIRRWAKRNPALASLSSLTAAMLLILLAVLAVWNRQQQDSLAEINQLYTDAEKNLIEKTSALEKERQANLRAEANLQLATNAFDGIIENIASRGSHLFDYEELGEDSLDFSGTMLSEADVSLLESLLSYFKQLGEQNDKDLSSETAAAHKRVGDIQQRIGKLEEAEKSYTTALGLYRSLSQRETITPNSNENSADTEDLESVKWLQQRLTIYIELLLVQSQQGKIWLAWESYNDCRGLIESNKEFSSSQEGRFRKANLLNCIGRISSQIQARPIRGERPPSLNPRDAKGNVNRSRWMEFAGLPLAARLRKEAELNREAIDLLTALVSESPDKAAYRSALAQALRDESRLAMLRNEKDESEKSLVHAIELLNSLIQRFPENSNYQYQLAETLWASTSRQMGRPPVRTSGSPPDNNEPMPFTTKDTDRLELALKICDDLLEEHPLEPAYLALKGAVLSRLGQAGGLIGRSTAVEYLYESVRLYSGLSDRFPELPLYRAQRIESLLKLSRIEPNRSKAIEHYDQAIEEADKLGNTRFRNQIGPVIERMRERRQSLESNKP